MTDPYVGEDPAAKVTEPQQLEHMDDTTALTEKANGNEETASAIAFDISSEPLKSIICSPKTMNKTHSNILDSDSGQSFNLFSKSSVSHPSASGKNISLNEGCRKLLVEKEKIALRKDISCFADNKSKRKVYSEDGRKTGSIKDMGGTNNPSELNDRQHCLPTSKALGNEVLTMDTFSLGYADKEVLNVQMSDPSPLETNDISVNIDFCTAANKEGAAAAAAEDHVSQTAVDQSAVCKDIFVEGKLTENFNPAPICQFQDGRASPAESVITVSDSVTQLADNETLEKNSADVASDRKGGTEIDQLLVRPSSLEAVSYTDAKRIEMNACSAKTFVETKVNVLNPAVTTKIASPECSLDMAICFNPHGIPFKGKKNTLFDYLSSPSTGSMSHRIMAHPASGSYDVEINTQLPEILSEGQSTWKPKSVSTFISPEISSSSMLHKSIRNSPKVKENEKGSRKQAPINTQPILPLIFPSTGTADSVNIIGMTSVSQIRHTSSCKPTPPSPCSSVSSCLFSVCRNNSGGRPSLNQNQQTSKALSSPKMASKFEAISSLPYIQQSQNPCTIASSNHMSKETCVSQLEQQEVEKERVKLAFVDTICQYRNQVGPNLKCLKPKVCKRNILKGSSEDPKDCFVPAETTTSLSYSFKPLTGTHLSVSDNVNIHQSSQTMLPTHLDVKSKSLKITPRCQSSEKLESATVNHTTPKKIKRAKGGKCKKTSKAAFVNQGYIKDYFSKLSTPCIQVKEPVFYCMTQQDAAPNDITSVSSNNDKISLHQHSCSSKSGWYKVIDSSRDRDQCLENSSMINIEDNKQTTSIMDLTSLSTLVKFNSVHIIHDAEFSAGRQEFVDFWSESFSDIRMTQEFWHSVDLW